MELDNNKIGIKLKQYRNKIDTKPKRQKKGGMMQKRKQVLLSVEDPKGEVRKKLFEIKEKTGIFSKNLLAMAIVKGLDVIECEWEKFQTTDNGRA